MTGIRNWFKRVLNQAGFMAFVLIIAGTAAGLTFTVSKVLILTLLIALFGIVFVVLNTKLRVKNEEDTLRLSYSEFVYIVWIAILAPAWSCYVVRFIFHS